MSWIKRIAGALMIAGASVNVAPVASAAEADPATHCLPFVDHPVICLVVCTAQEQSVKACNVQITCNPAFPVVCPVVGTVWDLVP